MSKIKLSILLLTSFFIFSCTNISKNYKNQQYSVAYIGGGYDGLLLKNYLISGLKSFNMYEKTSNYKINASIGHGTNLYITNIDNTSDREKINTQLLISVVNEKEKCALFNKEFNVSQFYIYSSNDKFLSNQKALKKIKKENTEALVRQFIIKLKKIESKCID